jgi:hypothetical protein
MWDNKPSAQYGDVKVEGNPTVTMKLHYRLPLPHALILDGSCGRRDYVN